MTIFFIILLLIFAVFGLPLFIVIGFFALLGYFYQGIPWTTYIAEGFSKVSSSPVFIAIPLFTFAGYIMAESKTPTRLVQLTRAFLGFIPGGLPIVALISCAFFTAFTGGSGITIVALGGLLLPALMKEGYPENFNLGLITISGSRGIVFPPSLPLIIFAMISALSLEGIVQMDIEKELTAKEVIETTELEEEELDEMLIPLEKAGEEDKKELFSVTVGKLFVAGAVPGILTILIIALYCVFVGIREKIPRHKFSIKNALFALKDAFWELWIPVIIIVGIYGGFITPVEAASITAFYVLIIEVFVYKDISLKKLPSIIIESMLLVGGILIILLSALALTNYFIDAKVPQAILSFLKTHIESKFTFLLLLNIFLIIVGCLMDIFSAILVVVPLITPLAFEYGVDPVHLGIIFLVNLEIGYSTPPVGMNLFVASFRFNQPVLKLYRASLPYLLLLFIGLIIITYIPEISLYLVRLTGIE